MKKLTLIFISFYLIVAGASLAFGENQYSNQEKDYLLNLARETLSWYLQYNVTPEPDLKILTDKLKENRPCFVTLEENSNLRGCIGLFEFTQPLYKNVISRAIAAATQDRRFNPVKSEELKDITIEISVLTEPAELKFASPEDLLNKLQPFEDGVILYTDYGNSTYLPQVWEQLPGKEEFLSSLCRASTITNTSPCAFEASRFNIPGFPCLFSCLKNCIL